jgi:hypothetical protein
MGLRDRIRRLQRRVEGPVVSIPQTDGTVKRFPESALREAFIEDLDRTAGRVGPEVPVHPILTALHNASETAPLGLFMGVGDLQHLEPLEDLSEEP